MQIASNMGTINDGAWHHAVATYDGSGLESGMKMYVDKVVSTTRSTTPVTSGILNNDVFSIGAISSGTGGIGNSGKLVISTESISELLLGSVTVS